MALRWNNNSNNHNGCELKRTDGEHSAQLASGLLVMFEQTSVLHGNILEQRASRRWNIISHIYSRIPAKCIVGCNHPRTSKCCMCSWRGLMDVYCISRINFCFIPIIRRSNGILFASSPLSFPFIFGPSACLLRVIIEAGDRLRNSFFSWSELRVSCQMLCI